MMKEHAEAVQYDGPVVIERTVPDEKLVEHTVSRNDHLGAKRQRPVACSRKPALYRFCRVAFRLQVEQAYCRRHGDYARQSGGKPILSGKILCQHFLEFG